MIVRDVVISRFCRAGGMSLEGWEGYYQIIGLMEVLGRAARPIDTEGGCEMQYLFDRWLGVSNGQIISKMADDELKNTNRSRWGELDRARLTCRTVTIELLRPGRLINKHDDRAAAKLLVEQMGGKARVGGKKHAMDYVGEWRRVSDNVNKISDMVLEETQHAYTIGIDTRSEEAIGQMFKLATLVWSTGTYTGYDQKEGPR